MITLIIIIMYVQPVCLVSCVQTEVTVFSIRLAQWSARPVAQQSGSDAEICPALSILLLLGDDSVVHKASCMPIGRAVFRQVPNSTYRSDMHIPHHLFTLLASAHLMDVRTHAETVLCLLFLQVQCACWPAAALSGQC